MKEKSFGSGAWLHIVKQLEQLDRMTTFLPCHNHIGSVYEEADLTKGRKGNWSNGSVLFMLRPKKYSRQKVEGKEGQNKHPIVIWFRLFDFQLIWIAANTYCTSEDNGWSSWLASWFEEEKIETNLANIHCIICNSLVKQIYNEVPLTNPLQASSKPIYEAILCCKYFSNFIWTDEYAFFALE